MSWWVRPAVLPDDPTNMINPDLPVLFVLETGGVADRVALNIVTERFGLQAPAEPLQYGSLRESSSVDLLRHRRGIIFRRHRLVRSKRLQRLVSAAINEGAGELQIVPVAVYWGRAPDKQRSALSLLFSENWQVGGRTRKLVTTLLYGRDTLLSISEPLSLSTLLELDATATTTPTLDNDERVQRKLSRILRVHFRQRRIASLGPDQSHRRTLISSVLADPGVRQAIEQTHKQDKVKRDRAQAKAHKYGLEIAADVSYPSVRVLHRLMKRLWTELYDGVELFGLDRLKSVAEGRELVYVPCHRSHIDYLLLSYILYINGYSLPHIAAGINLNLPVVGGVLRRGGAFFLRRTFAGNKLYAAVFNAYLKEILQRGHAIEYFVEGGRSRTGRLLPPKAGMLAMTAHAYLREPRTPVVFVPVYFGYERLLEGRAFTSELAGGKKQKESVFGLLKSLRTLREDYGHVYVNFGEPISLDTVLDKHQSDWRNQNITATKPDWLTPAINDLGSTIMRHINQAACITPISLLATALLATPRGHLSQPDLIQQMQVYLQLLKDVASGTTVEVPDIELANVIPHAQKLGFIHTIGDPLGELISIRPGRAASLTYFRNNILHLLTMPSLIACCFVSKSTRKQGTLQSLVASAYPYLQTELFLPEQDTELVLQQSLSALTDCGLLICEGENWRRATAGSAEAVSLIRLAEVVMPALERYFLAAAILVMSGKQGLTTPELAEKSRICAERLALTHGREVGELHDKHLFTAMIGTLENNGHITRTNDQLMASDKLLAIEAETRTMLTDQMRHAILNTLLCLPRPGE